VMYSARCSQRLRTLASEIPDEHFDVLHRSGRSPQSEHRSADTRGALRDIHSRGEENS
jgi:hypothetical protein